MLSLNPIYKLFGQSPIGPIQEHMNKVIQCTNELTPFIESVIADDWAKAEQIQANISQLEAAADDIKNNLRLHLPSGFFLPVPRTELLRLLGLQDKVANKAKDIAGIILGRKMTFPESVIPHYLEFLKHCILTVEKAHEAINKLDALLETGFKGHEVTLVEDLVEQLHVAEFKTDELQIQVRRHIFAVEKEFSPIDIMFLYKVIEATGELADRAEKVGGQLLVIVAK